MGLVPTLNLIKNHINNSILWVLIEIGWVRWIISFIFFTLICRDNFIILQALIAFMVSYMFPFVENLPLWNIKGIIAVLILHTAVSEPLFYWVHRYFHENHLFTHYHSLHHSSPVPQAFTGDSNINNNKPVSMSIWI